MTTACSDVATGWVVADPAEVPDGGEELVSLLADAGPSAHADPEATARKLGLDEGLVRRGLEKLGQDQSGGLELGSAPVVASTEDDDFPSSSRLPRVKSRKTAEELLVLASAVAPVTMERAKVITRMDGDTLEDIFDALVYSGRLIPIQGGARAWAKTK